MTEPDNMDAMPSRSFLDIFPIFRDGPLSLPQSILSSSSYHELKKDTQLYHYGDSCSGIGFLLEGEIRVYKISDTGREITLYEIYPGQTCILNAACILSKWSYPANATVQEDGKILILPEKVFRDQMEEYQVMRSFVFSLFTMRLGEIIELIDEVTFGKMNTRLADYLIEKSENNELQTTHQQIANDLGSSREVISRLLKDFTNQGKITQSRNHIRLNDLNF